MRANHAISVSGDRSMARGHRGERTLSAGMAALARRQLEIAAGVAMWALAAFALFSLATWNAGDPSWSFAADTPVANAMGYPGAVLSDLLMQFFGIAALPALLPLVFWGYARMRALYWPHATRRLILWPVAALLTAAAIGCFAVTEHWPLPTGLGGVLGDMLLRIPGMLSGGYPSGWVRVLAFLLFAPAAAYALAVSCGFLWQAAPETADEDADEETGLAGRFVFVGAAMHALYTTRAMVRRAIFGARRPVAPARREAVRTRSGPRVEPDFAGGPELALEPDFGIDAQDDDYDDAPDWAPEPPRGAASPATAPTARVAPVAPKPKPSVRVQREAQVSFIHDGGFDLPPIHLLAEPKNIGKDASLAPEALEQNARLLESVLAEFGVRGEIDQSAPARSSPSTNSSPRPASSRRASSALPTTSPAR